MFSSTSECLKCSVCTYLSSPCQSSQKWASMIIYTLCCKWWKMVRTASKVICPRPPHMMVAEGTSENWAHSEPLCYTSSWGQTTWCYIQDGTSIKNCINTASSTLLCCVGGSLFHQPLSYPTHPTCADLLYVLSSSTIHWCLNILLTFLNNEV